MTKKPGIVWNHYDKKVDGSQIIAFCKYCNQSYIQNATRMEKHLIRCDKAPESVKQIFSKHTINKAINRGGRPTKVEQPISNMSNIEGEWDEAFEEDRQTAEMSEDIDMALEAEDQVQRGVSNDLPASNGDWETVSYKQEGVQGPSTASPQEHASQIRRQGLTRRMSQWPPLSARTATSHSPLQSKILQEQLLERRIMRRVAELELRRKNLELERLQWEYERDKAHSELQLAHEVRMMEIKEEREKQALEREMAGV